MAKSMGFTGTSRKPLRKPQHARLIQELQSRAERVGEGEKIHFHLGDCINADAEAREIAALINFSYRQTNRPAPFWLVGHPGDNPAMRDFGDFDEEREPKPNLDRNRDIAESDEMLACPRTFNEQRAYSGTWHAIRCALQNGKEVIIIWPDGQTSGGRDWYLSHGRIATTLRAIKRHMGEKKNEQSTEIGHG
jgi:hypothetical protein